CCGTIAARCTGAIRSIPPPAASCTAPRSRAIGARLDRAHRVEQRLGNIAELAHRLSGFTFCDDPEEAMRALMMALFLLAGAALGAPVFAQSSGGGGGSAGGGGSTGGAAGSGGAAATTAPIQAPAPRTGQDNPGVSPGAPGPATAKTPSGISPT